MLEQYCWQCGTGLPTKAKFCFQCGVSVVERPASADDQPAPTPDRASAVVVPSSREGQAPRDVPASAAPNRGWRAHRRGLRRAGIVVAAVIVLAIIGTVAGVLLSDRGESTAEVPSALGALTTIHSANVPPSNAATGLSSESASTTVLPTTTLTTSPPTTTTVQEASSKEYAEVSSGTVRVTTFTIPSSYASGHPPSWYTSLTIPRSLVTPRTYTTAHPPSWYTVQTIPKYLLTPPATIPKYLLTPPTAP